MKISDVSEKNGLSVDTLRYYERIGLIPRVSRDQSGIRIYNERDCRWIEFIKCMRSAGLPVESLIEYVNLFQQGDSTRDARKTILLEQRAQLACRINELQETLEKLDYKIARYDDQMRVAEKSLSGKEF
jgi:DNA-binding transcriptional MerR regulator